MLSGWLTFTSYAYRAGEAPCAITFSMPKRRTRNPFASYGPVGDEVERPPVSLAKVTLPEGIEDSASRFLQFRTIKLGYEAWQAIDKAESFSAWCRIGAALSIGKAEALRTTGANRAAGQYYCQAFHRWIVDHGFGTMPHSDRSHAIALHENLAVITAWRDSLPERKRKHLITAQANVKRWRASLDRGGNSKCPADLKREAMAAWRRFRACLEALPEDQAASVWRIVQPEIALVTR
jgi:hypothetical protein